MHPTRLTVLVLVLARQEQQAAVERLEELILAKTQHSSVVLSEASGQH